jgi:group I intron endonuclease
MKNNYIVYKHTFPNNKVYIGITKNNKNRRWQYGNGYRRQPLIYRAIKKYNWNNVKHEVLYNNLSKIEAESKEIELIKKYKSNNPKYGYNVDNGGNCCGTHSKETLKKMSEAQKGKKNHMYGKKGELCPSYGRKLSIKTKEKLRKINLGKHVGSLNHMYGKHHSEETKQKIREKALGRKITEETRKKLSINSTIKKKVNQYDLNGNFIKQYESLTQAQKETGVLSQNIGKVCRGQQKYAKGYLWRYADDN